MSQRPWMLLLSLPVAACSPFENGRLRTEIATLNRDVAAIETEIHSSTGAAGSRTEDLHARVAYRPILAWSESFNNRPADQRTVTFRQTSQQGQIAKDDWNCGPFGHGGWYIEFNSSDATRLSLVIERLQLQATAGGIIASTPLTAHLGSQIHWHFDPCLGGGVGGSVGLTADKDFGAGLRLGFQPVSGNYLPYTLDLVSPSSLKITVVIHLGHIGNVGVPFEIKNVARRLGSGRIGLIFATSGEIGPLPNGQSFAYSLANANPVLTTGASGLEFNSDIIVTVTPQTAPPAATGEADYAESPPAAVRAKHVDPAT